MAVRSTHPGPELAGNQRPALHAVLFHARCCPSRASILTGQYPHKVGVGHMVTDMGHPGYRGRLSENAADDRRSLEAGRLPDLHVRQVARGNQRSDASWIRAVLRHAHQRGDVLGSRAIPAPAAGKQDPKLRPGCLLRDRRADRLRAGFSRGRPHDAGSAMVPLPGLQRAAFSAARAPRGHRQIPEPVHGGMGPAQTGAPGPNEAAAAGGERHAIVAALEVHQLRRDRQRARTRRGTASRKTAARIWRCGWRSTRRWSIAWTRTSGA